LIESKGSHRFFQSFYMRRVHRILPIYYSWILLFLCFRTCAQWISPNWKLLNTYDFSGIPFYFAFLQNFIFDRTRLEWIWFSVTWSLAVAEQFYLAAPPLIRFLSPRKLTSVLVAVVFAAPVARLLIFKFLPAHSYFVTLAMPCRADALGIGILSAIYWQDLRFRAFLERRPEFLRNILIVLSMGVGALARWLIHPVSMVTATAGYSWLAFFYCALMLYVLQRPSSLAAQISRWRSLRQLGTISYCVYIIHETINYFAHGVVHKSAPELNDSLGIVAMLLAIAVTLGIASASWKFFERPLIRSGHRFEY
jgi:peptidoglycan/LPS O-acetylase OafA/YrhL